MTAPSLRVPCVHGKWEAHDPYSEWIDDAGNWREGFMCEGGREPTVEETTQWLKERRAGKGYPIHRIFGYRP